MFSERNFKDHGWSDWSLMPYGHGNGGGGPTREMIERARRMRRSRRRAARLPSAPPTSSSTTSRPRSPPARPCPCGAASCTSRCTAARSPARSKTKVGNRRCERLLREAELWWAAAGGVPTEVAAELDELWKDVLLQQFHDIIPGSSITWVHDDAEAAHARVADRLEELIARGVRA